MFSVLVDVNLSVASGESSAAGSDGHRPADGDRHRHARLSGHSPYHHSSCPSGLHGPASSSAHEASALPPAVRQLGRQLHAPQDPPTEREPPPVARVEFRREADAEAAAVSQGQPRPRSATSVQHGL